MSQLTKPSEGYFLAKRRMADAMANRIDILEKEQASLVPSPETIDRIREISIEIKVLEKTRSYVRNFLLWDTSEGP
jgi:hypothetical protein